MILNSTNIKAIKRFKTLEADFHNVHNKEYDYSKFIYVNARTKGTIICSEHGEFNQLPSNHLKGHKCPKCAKENNIGQYNTDTKSTVLAKFNAVHKGKYTYDKVHYTDSKTKVIITCPEHSDFEQTPKAHTAGQGCPECGKLTNAEKRKGQNYSGGWSHTSWEKKGVGSDHFVGFTLYIIECWSDTEKFIKIGKTFRPLENRYKGPVSMPYEWRVIKCIEGSAKYISSLEIELHNKFKLFKYTPINQFRGMTECFNITEPDIM